MHRIRSITWRLMTFLSVIVPGLFLAAICFAADQAAPAPPALGLAGWIVANKLAIIAIFYAAASEIIGLSGLKSNAVVQLAMSVLNKIIPQAAAVVVLAVFCLTACGGQAVLKTTEITKATAETALKEARSLEKAGTITADQFAEVVKAYDALEVAQDTLIDAREKYLASPTQDTQAAVDAAVVALASESGKLINIARTYKIGEGLLW